MIKEIEMNKTESSLMDIEREIAESAECEFNDLHSIASGRASKNLKSGLLAKLSIDPSHSFPISDYSYFAEDRWVLLIQKTGRKKDILFNSELLGSNTLKKFITYYLIPDFHPFGRIRSYISTHTYSHAHSYLEKHLFRANGLNATPENIKAITVNMVNDALDSARDYHGHRHYVFLYFYITFWLSLSSQELVPSGYRLNLSMRHIDTKERQKDIQHRVAEERVGWSPFSEEELAKLVEHALFWTEKAMPKLLDIKRYLKDNGYSDNQKKHKHVISTKELPDLVEILNIRVEGVVICGVTISKTSTERVTTAGNVYFYHTNFYRWVNPYKKAVDKVRDGVLILLALITGMRNRELCELKFDDIFQSEDGEWYVKITRFKTSNDPNYYGEVEEVPLPAFIGEIISGYKELRTGSNFMHKGYVLQQIKKSKNATVTDRSIQRAAKSLGDELGIEHVHPHRFRKTIAEILINRSERNIDLIRMMFGHKSYSMTLRYIARNPYLINSITETMEIHYAADFIDIVAAVKNGGYSGKVAEAIADKASVKPKLFAGKLLRLTIQQYVSYLLEAGEPLFIQRTTLGTYCVSSESYTSNNLPPCLAGREFNGEVIIPNTSNCQLECINAVVLDNARDAVNKNIIFYTNLLKDAPKKLKKTAQMEIKKKIKINQRHLANLDERSCSGAPMSNEKGL